MTSLSNLKTPASPAQRNARLEPPKTDAEMKQVHYRDHNDREDSGDAQILSRMR
jgi:hypothetical protein